MRHEFAQRKQKAQLVTGAGRRGRWLVGPGAGSCPRDWRWRGCKGAAGGRALSDSAKVCRDNGFEPKLYQMLSRNSGGQKRELGAFIMITQPLDGMCLGSSPYKPDLFMEQRSRRHGKLIQHTGMIWFILSYILYFYMPFSKNCKLLAEVWTLCLI